MSREFGHKTQTRYVIEKEIEGEWIMMARLGKEALRIRELCAALGGKIRVHDLKKRTLIFEKEFA